MDGQDVPWPGTPVEYGYRYGRNRDWISYMYPVPVQHETTQNISPPPTQFLFCKTSRAFLHGVPETSTNGSSTMVRLYLEGNNVGFVTLMSPELEEILAKDTKAEDAVFELVAISEGWACWDDGSDGDPYNRRWNRYNGKQCYHVLCVGWEENVAYRRGVGCVLKETWEEMREEELVDLILG
jgi:hypothetical protein